MCGDNLFGLGDRVGGKEDKDEKIGWNQIVEVCKRWLRSLMFIVVVFNFVWIVK